MLVLASASAAGADGSSAAPHADPGMPNREDVIPFPSERWILRDARITEFLGRECLMGFAYLDDVELQDGVIEVDVAVLHERSYPGIVFRLRSEQDYERLYLRPHRMKFYTDALQYTPVFNGIAEWQLWNGEGATAGVEIPFEEWVYLRLEMSGSQARLFVGDAAQPALVMTDLGHGASRGSVGVMGPTDGTAYFSNFSCRADDGLVFEDFLEEDVPPGVIGNWQLSQSFRLGDIDLEQTPQAQGLEGLSWSGVACEANGLVDIGRWMGRSGPEPDCVLARTRIPAEQDGVMQMLFGYSDVISIFLNGRLLFLGNSAYRQRDPSFLGIVGLNDAVYLPLKKGVNELELMVVESFGGWAFVCRDGSAVFRHAGLAELREAHEGLLTPESVVYDAARSVLYVSNFDIFGRASAAGGQFISRLSPAGEMLDSNWLGGLNRPTGMTVQGNTLWVVERGSLVEVDIAAAAITARHAIPGAVFPNDVAIDASGAIYVSDSAGNKIHRFAGGVFEEWLAGGAVGDPNALFVRGDTLLWGNSGDDRLKGIDLKTGVIRVVARFPSGIIDGIRLDEEGNYLVSQWEGRLFRVSPAGEREKLLDTSVPGVNAADFEYIASEGRLFVPTFRDDRVVVYRLGG